MKTGLSRFIHLVLSLIVILPNLVHAQSKFAVIAEGGPSMNYVHSKSIDASTITPIIGGFVGISFQYGFSDHFALEAGMAYERKGADLLLPLGFTGYRINYTFHFDYLTVPLLCKVTFGKKVRFIASAGPYISYLINQTYINNDHEKYFSGGIYPDQSTYDTKNSIDFGVIAGIGMELLIAKHYAISLEFRDHYGLIDTQLFPVFTSSYGDKFNSNRSSYNNSVIASLGVTYYFKGKVEK